jgi:hypothetical protein
MNKRELLNEVVRLMIQAGHISTFSGKQKKDFVMLELARHITLDNELEEFILLVVDMLIQVENEHIVFNKQIAKRFNCCF